ncbi:hypothetical protein [Dyadobacter sp. 32]|uniref:hypothetical protein n=1 Tax=Dyadobacter sp. 32 TaxID=538966 RepID=UPI0011EC9905
MKNVIVSALALALISMGTVQSKGIVESNSVVVILQEKVPVKPEDLPEAVKTALAGDAYKGWEVTGASLVTKEDKTQYFEIAVKKGEETATVNLDKEGKKVE